MGRKRIWGRFKIEGTISSFLEDAKQEIEELREEMATWRDNMGESEGLAATERYQRVEEAASSLEYADLELEAPEEISGIEITANEVRKRSPSRQVRLQNALDRLQAILDCDTGYLMNIDVDEFMDSISDAISELQGIEFPGMYD